MKQHIGPLGGPIGADLFGLVMGQAADTGAHHHHRGGDAVDPAGIVPGTADDIHMGISQPFSRRRL